MPNAERIIECTHDEVNASTSIRRKKILRVVRSAFVRRAFAASLLCCALAAVACDRSEQKAEALVNEAMERVAADDLERAVQLLDEATRLYPNTAAGRRARQERLLYGGLAVAVDTYAQRAARDLMIRTSKALDRSRRARRAWPASLDRLLPELIAEPPIDPWGRPLAYERKANGRGYRLSCLGSDGRPGGTGDAADLLVDERGWVASPTAG